MKIEYTRFAQHYDIERHIRHYVNDRSFCAGPDEERSVSALLSSLEDSVPYAMWWADSDEYTTDEYDDVVVDYPIPPDGRPDAVVIKTGQVFRFHNVRRDGTLHEWSCRDIHEFSNWAVAIVHHQRIPDLFITKPGEDWEETETTATITI